MASETANSKTKESHYIDTNMKIHDEEKNFEKTSDDDYDNEFISAAVNTNDDPTLPCLTFRFWFFTTLGAVVSVFSYFRSNILAYSIFFVILVSYIMGKWMEKILPNKKFRIKNWEFSLNPGPFNYKEHVCIAAAAGAGAANADHVEVILVQELFYNTKVNFLIGFMLLISIQMIGYGLAGFARKYLVRPANMIWPQALVYTTIFNTLHGNASQTNDKIRFFTIAFISIFVWQFVPEYIFPWLASASVLCLIDPHNNVVNVLGSVYKGAGILSFSFDWNAIGEIFPLYTPWWSQVNFYIGIVLCIWIIGPLLYFNNVFDAQKFPFLSTSSFDKNGNKYNQTRIIDPATGALDVAAYENYSPVYLSATMAAHYGYYFMLFPATICHFILFFGREVWNRYKKTREEEEENDIHCKMMNVYPEVPYYWYGTIFIVMVIIAIILGYTNNVNLPWWGSLFSVAFAAFMMLPIGIIQAISNWQFKMNNIIELMCGFLLPGYPIANVYFKVYESRALSQCLYFVQDLKLGHYMKIPPRSMFTSQIWGTFVGAIVEYWAVRIIINTKKDLISMVQKLIQLAK
ncbi:opt family small oligopeptide transporter [Gigaspora margarita]|uniref:Opt family small oligopeptide transporter n=1 Tax=Gigaspora margarita TaxID=4874 RepID=A0A8H4A3V1_GIGMA|nr:opt family small oligopeptide transporter [Gigaspora margarita]